MTPLALPGLPASPVYAGSRTRGGPGLRTHPALGMASSLVLGGESELPYNTHLLRACSVSDQGEPESASVADSSEIDPFCVQPKHF